MPIFQEPWPSRRPEVQPPADLAHAADSAVLHAVQSIRALRVPGAVNTNDRRTALMRQRADLMVWLPLVGDDAWISKGSVAQIISALERQDESPEQQAAVTARIEGAVTGTLVPEFPGLSEHDVELIDAVRPNHDDRRYKSEMKEIHKLAPDSVAIKEAVADQLGGYVDDSFESAVVFFKTAWGSPDNQGVFWQAERGKPRAEVSFAKQQIAVGGVTGLTHLYTWR